MSETIVSGNSWLLVIVKVSIWPVDWHFMSNQGQTMQLEKQVTRNTIFIHWLRHCYLSSDLLNSINIRQDISYFITLNRILLK